LSAPTVSLAAVCLPEKFRNVCKVQKATGRAWIALEQNIIDTAVNE